MRKIAKEFEEHLKSGATTLCYCLKITRNDGELLGFTDHDKKITFDGITFEENNGMQTSKIASSTGLNVDNLDILGALNSKSLKEHELAGGLFDNAEVEIYLVNWQVPEHKMLLNKGNIGEVTRSDISFTAEVRGLSHLFNQPTGRIYQTRCDASLGDERCKIDIDKPTISKQAKIHQLKNKRSFITTNLAEFHENWFFKGKLKWISGLNVNTYFDIKNSIKDDDGGTLIELWQAVNNPMVSGDEFIIYAGCDKSIDQCNKKFSNCINFRGFPHIPGNNFITYYPKPK